MATQIVRGYDRIRAARNASQIVDHQLNRIWDAVQTAQEFIEQGQSDKALTEINKITSLAGSTRIACNQWISLERDNKRAEESEAAGKAANDSSVQAIVEAPLSEVEAATGNCDFIAVPVPPAPNVTGPGADTDIPF